MINLKIHPRCLERIEHWTDVAPGEFSALGVVQKIGEELIVPELFLPQQTCDEASTEMDPDDVARLLIALEREGKDPRSLRLWLHSHGDMNCFWSAQDAATIEEMSNNGYLVSIVVNKAGDLLCRVDVFAPFRFTFDKVRVAPLLQNYNLRAQCKAEIAEKVKPNPTKIFTDPNKQGALFDDFAADFFAQNECLAIEQKLHAGEITMTEYLAQLDEMEAFV
jgi:proteasome lid subunit RPN8/RPN11